MSSSAATSVVIAGDLTKTRYLTSEMAFPELMFKIFVGEEEKKNLRKIGWGNFSKTRKTQRILLGYSPIENDFTTLKIAIGNHGQAKSHDDYEKGFSHTILCHDDETFMKASEMRIYMQYFNAVCDFILKQDLHIIFSKFYMKQSEFSIENITNLLNGQSNDKEEMEMCQIISQMMNEQKISSLNVLNYKFETLGQYLMVVFYIYMLRYKKRVIFNSRYLMLWLIEFFISVRFFMKNGIGKPVSLLNLLEDYFLDSSSCQVCFIKKISASIFKRENLREKTPERFIIKSDSILLESVFFNVKRDFGITMAYEFEHDCEDVEIDKQIVEVNLALDVQRIVSEVSMYGAYPQKDDPETFYEMADIFMFPELTDNHVFNQAFFSRKISFAFFMFIRLMYVSFLEFRFHKHRCVDGCIGVQHNFMNAKISERKHLKSQTGIIYQDAFAEIALTSERLRHWLTLHYMFMLNCFNVSEGSIDELYQNGFRFLEEKDVMNFNDFIESFYKDIVSKE